jgi:hypothetical protein
MNDYYLTHHGLHVLEDKFIDPSLAYLRFLGDSLVRCKSHYYDSCSYGGTRSRRSGENMDWIPRSWKSWLEKRQKRQPEPTLVEEAKPPESVNKIVTEVILRMTHKDFIRAFGCRECGAETFLSGNYGTYEKPVCFRCKSKEVYWIRTIKNPNMED